MLEKLERRVALLEAEVTRLKAALKAEEASSEDQPWWEKRVGMFADDSIYDEAMKLGREYRKSLKTEAVESAVPQAKVFSKDLNVQTGH